MNRCRCALAAEAGGFAPAEFALAVGLWLFPLALLVVSLPLWVERLSLARVAAQEAARAVAVAQALPEGTATARDLVARMASNHGVTSADVRLAVDGTLARGGVVTATVSVRVPALHLPLLADTAAFTVESRHSEAVDHYRAFDP